MHTITRQASDVVDALISGMLEGCAREWQEGDGYLYVQHLDCDDIVILGHYRQHEGVEVADPEVTLKGTDDGYCPMEWLRFGKAPRQLMRVDNLMRVLWVDAPRQRTVASEVSLWLYQIRQTHDAWFRGETTCNSHY